MDDSEFSPQSIGELWCELELSEQAEFTADLLGVVTRFRCPFATRGSDYKSEVDVVDDSLEPRTGYVKVQEFSRTADLALPMRCVGDIVMVVGARVKVYSARTDKKHLQATMKRSRSSFYLFDGGDDNNFEPLARHVSGAASTLQISSAPSQRVKDMISRLRTWTKENLKRYCAPPEPRSMPSQGGLVASFPCILDSIGFFFGGLILRIEEVTADGNFARSGSRLTLVCSVLTRKRMRSLMMPLPLPCVASVRDVWMGGDHAELLATKEFTSTVELYPNWGEMPPMRIDQNREAHSEQVPAEPIEPIDLLDTPPARAMEIEVVDVDELSVVDLDEVVDVDELSDMEVEPVPVRPTEQAPEKKNEQGLDVKGTEAEAATDFTNMEDVINTRSDDNHASEPVQVGRAPVTPTEQTPTPNVEQGLDVNDTKAEPTTDHTNTEAVINTRSDDGHASDRVQVGRVSVTPTEQAPTPNVEQVLDVNDTEAEPATDHMNMEAVVNTRSDDGHASDRVQVGQVPVTPTEQAPTRNIEQGLDVNGTEAEPATHDTKLKVVINTRSDKGHASYRVKVQVVDFNFPVNVLEFCRPRCLECRRFYYQKEQTLNRWPVDPADHNSYVCPWCESPASTFDFFVIVRLKDWDGDVVSAYLVGDDATKLLKMPPQNLFQSHQAAQDLTQSCTAILERGEQGEQLDCWLDVWEDSDEVQCYMIRLPDV